MAKTQAGEQASATQAIDHLLAKEILDRLGYTLQDLSLEFGDVVIPSGDISHILHYLSHYSTFNSMGSIWVENGIYYVSGNMNYETPEQAALELINERWVKSAAAKILLERQMLPDYF